MLVASTALPGTERLGRRRGEEATAEDLPLIADAERPVEMLMDLDVSLGIAASAGTGEELEQDSSRRTVLSLATVRA